MNEYTETPPEGTWQEKQARAAEEFIALAMDNPTAVSIMCDNNVFYVSADGGDTWSDEISQGALLHTFCKKFGIEIGDV